jgi:hypothetical protein
MAHCIHTSQLRLPSAKLRPHQHFHKLLRDLANKFLINIASLGFAFI